MSGDSKETVVVVTPAKASAPGKSGVHALARWLYTSNPFYMISAALVFAGLWISFGPTGESSIPWGLAGGLGGYVVLLTVTSCLLARHANVWNDIRSMLLLIVLMLVALSFAFDETLTENPERGALQNLGLLAFSIGISELILGYLAIRFPIHFRLPYYLLLMIFFVYPARVACAHFEPGTDALHWALFGFGLAVSAALLTLLPAARRGRALFARSGTPWPWPLFPWSVFFILTLCACGRAYFLCVSLDFIGGSANVFGVYFLVPIWIAVAFLVLELGLQARSGRTVDVALAMAFATPLLACGGRSEAVYQQFLAAFSTQLGVTPFDAAICLTIGFLGIAALRRVRGAADLLTIALVFLAAQRQRGGWFEHPATFAALLLVAAAGLQLLLAATRRSSACALTASILAVAALSLRFDWGRNEFSLVIHSLFMLGFLVAAVFDDDLARRLRRGGWIVVLLFSGLAAIDASWPWRDASRWMVAAYPLAWAILALAYGWLLRLRSYHVAAGIIGASWLAMVVWRGYQQLRLEVAGLDYLAGGLLCFAVAVLVSLAKAGLTGRWLAGVVPRGAVVTERLKSNG